MSVGEQNHLNSSSETGAKSSFLSMGEVSETQIRKESGLQRTKTVWAESQIRNCGGKHIAPVLLSHSSWKGALSKQSRALEKHLLACAVMAALVTGDQAAPGSLVSSLESTRRKLLSASSINQRWWMVTVRVVRMFTAESSRFLWAGSGTTARQCSHQGAQSCPAAPAQPPSERGQQWSSPPK